MGNGVRHEIMFYDWDMGVNRLQAFGDGVCLDDWVAVAMPKAVV